MGKARVKPMQQTWEIKEIKQIAQGCMRRTSVCGHPEPQEERPCHRGPWEGPFQQGTGWIIPGKEE